MSKPYIKIVGLTEKQKRDVDVAASQVGMSLSRFCWNCIRLALVEHSVQSIAAWPGEVEPYPKRKRVERKAGGAK